MKRFLLIISLLMTTLFVSMASTSETLKYVVSYKWGLIQKDAGDVTITKIPKGSGYELKLTAKSRPWADKIYKVRDTLISITKKDKFLPLQYTSIAHEKNKYKRDDITFTYSGSTVKGAAQRFREDKNGEVSESKKDLQGTSPVYDMLSIYFFIRDINFANMKKGDTVNATIFSGDKVEQLKVRCEGKETIKLKDKSEREAWHVLFNFTSGGGKKSSDDINCWISTDPSHVPLLIVGNLPIGQIRVNLQS